MEITMRFDGEEDCKNCVIVTGDHDSVGKSKCKHLEVTAELEEDGNVESISFTCLSNKKYYLD
jgi:hypothetical protein